MATSPPDRSDWFAVRTRGALDAAVRPPGSKSLTNRALAIAALARGESTLVGALASEDTEAMCGCLEALGCPVVGDGDTWHVPGRDGRFSAPTGPLFAKNSGTTIRFLAAAATLADGPVTLDGDARMRERPIGDLVDALTALGAPAEVRGAAGCPPVHVAGKGLPGGATEIDGTRSSQVVSAVLMAAPYAQRDVTLSLRRHGLVSRPYVDLTLDTMRAFGAEAAWTSDDGLRVRAGRRYAGRTFAIEPDASAAAYPFCAAAIAGGRVRVTGIPAASIQADLALLPILERMGCQVARGADYAEVRRDGRPLQGVDVDMNALPDAALALAVVAIFAEGPTRIRNVANLRLKETDRLAALETELRRLGADATAGPDSLEIVPGPLRGAPIETYDDHRMAMSFALAGLRVPGVTIRDPACVAKTWPDYFSTLEHL
ncbi:MAG: 3-phosphoshikimate 1-carboxyvinyltransferase [Myxococcota bacterium]|nr:3-phosphoshikimate 1-carboxyvinyltransferase [Myxococcota bacterium]